MTPEEKQRAGGGAESKGVADDAQDYRRGSEPKKKEDKVPPEPDRAGGDGESKGVS